MLAGTFVLGEIRGDLGKRLAEITARYDPKLSRSKPPHVTLAGSSGIGPLPTDLPVSQIAAAVEPVAASMGPIELKFGAPSRFLQTNIVILPLDPHGPLRVLHDRIASCGLPFGRARYTFTPHVTLSLYSTLSNEAVRELLAVRVAEPYVLDALQIYLTRDPQPSKKLLELQLGMPAARSR